MKNHTLFFVVIFMMLFFVNVRQAIAVINLDNGTGAITYTTAQTPPNKLINNMSNILDVNVALGSDFSANDSDIYIRFDLIGNATFNNDLTNSNLTATNLTGVSISMGGIANDNYVIYNAISGSSGVTSNDILTLVLPTINLSDSSDVQLQYRLYSQPGDAVNTSGSTLKNISNFVIDFNFYTVAASINLNLTTLLLLLIMITGLAHWFIFRRSRNKMNVF